MRTEISKLVKLLPQSLLGDFYRIFGPIVTDKLLTVFGGCTIQIPSTKDMDEAVRDYAIYVALESCGTGADSKRMGEVLCQKYDIKRKELRKVYRLTKAKLKEATRVIESDRRVSQHQPSRIKQKRQSKRRL